MPRKATGDDETPRRRRRAAAAAVEAETERGLAMRVLLHSPKDTVACLLAFAATVAIITNALFLQRGPHPAPIFGHAIAFPSTLMAASPMPRPRPLEADEPKQAEPRAFEPRYSESRPTESKPADPLANLVKATASIPITQPSGNVIRPPAPIPTAVPSASARRVAAIQRVLTQYGYGQLKPTGTVGPETQAAIQRFERERRMPVTGQVSERLMRELAAVTGHPID